jgi:hypothetical protein
MMTLSLLASVVDAMVAVLALLPFQANTALITVKARPTLKGYKTSTSPIVYSLFSLFFCSFFAF